MQFTSLLYWIELFLGGVIGLMLPLVASDVYPVRERVVVLIGLTSTLACAAAIVSARQVGDRLKSVGDALGRPAEFFPKELEVDDGQYFRDLARHVSLTERDETI